MSLPLPPCHHPQPLIGPFSQHKVGASRLHTLCMYVMCVMRVWCNGWLKVPDGLVAKAMPNEVLQSLDFTTFMYVCV